MEGSRKQLPWPDNTGEDWSLVSELADYIGARQDLHRLTSCYTAEAGLGHTTPAPVIRNQPLAGAAGGTGVRREVGGSEEGCKQ